MADLRVAATASRLVAAPRAAILRFELDPRNTVRVEPRMVISELVWDSEGRASTWTATLPYGKVFRVTFTCVRMAIDPVVVELRNKHQRQTSTATVSAEPDAEGRYALTYAVEAAFKSTWLTRLQHAKYQASTDRDLERQIDAAVALMEADASAATEATDPR